MDLVLLSHSHLPFATALELGYAIIFSDVDGCVSYLCKTSSSLILYIAAITGQCRLVLMMSDLQTTNWHLCCTVLLIVIFCVHWCMQTIESAHTANYTHAPYIIYYITLYYMLHYIIYYIIYYITLYYVLYYILHYIIYYIIYYLPLPCAFQPE